MAGPFTTPLGRIVQGDPYKMNPRIDDKSKLPKMKADGSPMLQLFVALAIPKNDPEWTAHRAALDAVDRATWPALWDASTNAWKVRDFADKIIDGDSGILDKSGMAPNSREGWAGHWIVKFTNGFPAKVMVAKNGVWVESPGGEVKCGDWVRVSYSTESNESQQSPGMYRNVEQIALYRTDTAIISSGGPTADERFGAPPPAGNAPSPAPAASPPPLAATTPPPPTASPTSAPPPPPAPAILHVMTEKAAGASYDSFVGNGWTDQQMIDAGYMVA